MRALFIFLLFLVTTLPAMAGDTLKSATPRIKPKAFVQVGGIGEIWRLSSQLKGSYTSANYYGGGYYAGLGMIKQVAANNHLSYGAGVDYFTYNMRTQLKTDENLNTTYSFLRLTPAIYITSNPDAQINLKFSGAVNIMTELGTGYTGYVQGSLGAGVQYQAWSGAIGYNFNLGSSAPVTGHGTLREKSIYIQVRLFPALLPEWPQFLSKLKLHKS